jgi:hypothetical protein
VSSVGRSEVIELGFDIGAGEPVAVKKKVFVRDLAAIAGIPRWWPASRPCLSPSRR